MRLQGIHRPPQGGCGDDISPPGGPTDGISPLCVRIPEHPTHQPTRMNRAIWKLLDELILEDDAINDVADLSRIPDRGGVARSCWDADTPSGRSASSILAKRSKGRDLTSFIAGELLTKVTVLAGQMLRGATSSTRGFLMWTRRCAPRPDRPRRGA